MVVTSSMFREGLERGYLVRRPNGSAYTYSGFGADAGLVDYSNPEAVSWIQGKLRRLFGLGVSAIKVDFGEGAPTDAVYHGGPAKAMHNLYPLLYGQAIFEATEEYWGQGQGVIWARSGWAGSQRYPVHWSGDGIARYADLPCVLRSALSFGLSGFPFYSHDVGGFSGLPSPDLYVRWAQLGMFSSHCRCHGVPPREPWAYGKQAEAIFRRYAELRYRLMPYIYSEAVASARHSLPMVRALVLDHQDDPTAALVEDQYLFGQSLLVAPILDSTGQRLVYLPPGTWTDYWTKEPLEGGRWIDVTAPLDILPLYVRPGAVLPYGPVMQHTDERPYDPLTIEVYRPRGRAAYTVHDEARPDIRVTYECNADHLTLRTDPAPGRVRLALYGVTVVAAASNGEPVALERTVDGGALVHLDGSTSTITRFHIQAEDGETSNA
jgi:alpha-D-xyloside xylohydrolase